MKEDAYMKAFKGEIPYEEANALSGLLLDSEDEEAESVAEKKSDTETTTTGTEPKTPTL